jgi:hypothetical protein
MDMDSRSFPRGGIRVSDADRDRAVTELSEHFQAGRLTQDEFEDRSGQALRARTGEDLRGLFTDLPQRPLATLPPPEFLQREPAAQFGPDSGPVPPYGRPPHRLGPPAGARAVIGLVLLAFIAVNVVSGNVGHHHAFGLLVPVAILGFVFLRLLGHRHR